MQLSLRELYTSLIIFFKSVLNDKQFMITLAVACIIFIGIGFYIYETIIKPNISFSYISNKEFVNDTFNEENNEDILIMLFKTEWCPHCKQSMPEWYKFDDYIKKLNTIFDYNIKTSIIDCDKQEDIANKYKIVEYPSIILLYKNNIYEYDAAADKDNLISFLKSSTNKKFN